MVSDEAFEAVLSERLLSRDQYKRIKTFDRKQMERYEASVYRQGFEDGAEAMQKCEDEVRMPWEDVLGVIGEVKGVGEKLLKAIDEHVREVMG